MNKKKILSYSKVFFKCFYRPIKPIADSLLKQIKVRRVLIMGIILVALGTIINKGRVVAQEKAAWWPWSSKVHSKMSLAWFESGEEEESLRELALADSWQLRFRKNREAFEVAQKKVSKPTKVRQEIVDWESFLSQARYYRDGWLRLAELEYSQYNDNKAREQFKIGEYLDPIGENTLRVEKLFER